MAKNRSRRLRKKMHIDEFQELGFSVAWRFPEGTSEEQIDKTVDDFINEVIEPNKLAFDGSGYLAWEGLICMQEIGKCTEEHQAIVRKWLEELPASSMPRAALPPSSIRRRWSVPCAPPAWMASRFSTCATTLHRAAPTWVCSMSSGIARE